MSQENVERFREAVEGINAGDIETALNVMHPDVEWRTLGMFPDAETYHGPEGVLAFFQTWLETFKGFQLHLENCAAAGEVSCGQQLNDLLYGMPSSNQAERAISDLEKHGYFVFGE